MRRSVLLLWLCLSSFLLTSVHAPAVGETVSQAGDNGNSCGDKKMDKKESKSKKHKKAQKKDSKKDRKE